MMTAENSAELMHDDRWKGRDYKRNHNECCEHLLMMIPGPGA